MSPTAHERPARGTPDGALVLLPGYGDGPDPWVALLDQVDPAHRWHAAVPTPPLSTDDGPAWFTVGDDGPDEDQLTAAVEGVVELARSLLDRWGLTPDRLVLAGHSQGGALALATLIDPSVPLRAGGAAALAGYLPHRGDRTDPERAAGVPVLVAHGGDDQVVDLVRGRGAARALERGRAHVTWSEVAGGHRLGPPLTGALARWLDQLHPAGTAAT